MNRPAFLRPSHQPFVQFCTCPACRLEALLIIQERTRDFHYAIARWILAGVVIFGLLLLYARVTDHQPKFEQIDAGMRWPE